MEQILNKTALVVPGSIEVAILRAEAYVAQGQAGRAVVMLKKTRDQQPDQVELWIALAELANVRKRPSQHFPFSTKPSAGWVIVSSSASRLRTIGRSAEVRKHPKHLPNWSETLRPSPLATRSDSSVALADGICGSVMLGGNRLLSQLIQLRPFDVSLLFSRFTLALQLGDQEAMERSLEELKAMGSGLENATETSERFCACAKARFLWWLASRESRLAVKMQQLDEARQLLIKAGSLRPSWSAGPVLRGGDRRTRWQHPAGAQGLSPGDRVRYAKP